jgi:hypothetical protein
MRVLNKGYMGKLCVSAVSLEWTCIFVVGQKTDCVSLAVCVGVYKRSHYIVFYIVNASGNTLMCPSRSDRECYAEEHHSLYSDGHSCVVIVKSDICLPLMIIHNLYQRRDGPSEGSFRT